MIRFCPQCGKAILAVIEEIPADDCNDAKTIASCDDCTLVVHVFHLQPVSEQWKEKASAGDGDDGDDVPVPGDDDLQWWENSIFHPEYGGENGEAQ